MLYIDELKENYEDYNLPERFVNSLIDTCPDCGGRLVMTETFTSLHCENLRCRSKIMMRIKAICKDLNILQFGEETIYKFIDSYGITNPLSIFELKPGMILGYDVSNKVSEKVIAQIIGKRDFYLWEYIYTANLPYIRTSAKKIFSNYKTLEDAYVDIEKGGIEWVREKLGINQKDGETSVQAIKVYQTLLEYKEDLLECINCVNIKSENFDLDELKIVCSDQVGGGFSRKQDFYDYINENYSDIFRFNILTSVSKDIDFLIWAGADGSSARYTSKVQKVEGYIKNGCEIQIVTAEDFIKVLDDYRDSLESE